MLGQAKETILLVHYHYPPLRNSGVYRNYFLSHAFAEAGYEVKILTTANVNRLPVEELPSHPSVFVQTIPTFDYRTLASFFASKQKRGAQFSETKKKGHFIRLFMRIQRSFPFHLVLGEGGLMYIMLGFLKAKKIIKEHNISKVYTSFMPYADHWIGWLLKKAMPQIQWVADFRDLHAEPIYNNIVWPGLQQRFEKAILQNASLVTAVSDGIASKLKALHPNVISVSKGVSVRMPQQKYPRFTISYTGSLFLEYRDPSPLFKAMRNMIDSGEINPDNIRFIYAGKDSRQMMQWVDAFELRHSFVDAGFVPRDQAIEIQDNSHVNLLLTTASVEHTGLMTGKLFEYLEAATPVLCIVKGSKDTELENVISQTNAGVIVYEPSHGGISCEDVLRKWYKEWQECGFISEKPDVESLRSNFSWQSRAQKILHALS